MRELFAPWHDLAAFLLSAFDANGTDGSHDLSHIVRVWRNASRIAATESARITATESARITATEPGCDIELILAAVILHDCVAVEKNSPQRSIASRLSAAKARDIVAPLRWSAARVEGLAHAIEAHSFSAGVAPETPEAKIVQDADRLDAIGAIGIARCFHVGGRMGGALYRLDDPAAEARELDDRAYALDHFSAKLFKVVDGFQTREGQRLAAARATFMTAFVTAFRAEIDGV